jgi:diadenosine tetraphosphatase ApaH/serine/threonine PP2A family protein phosphatase
MPENHNDGTEQLSAENQRLREALAPFANRAAERAAGGPYRHIRDSEWARALEVFTALEDGGIDQDARRRIESAVARRGADLRTEVARLRRALNPEDRLGAGRVIHKDYQPSNVADLVHCLNIWLGQENERMRQDFETAKPHGDFTVATHHMHQAEAIKAEIERLIEVCEEALGEVAPVTVPSELD